MLSHALSVSLPVSAGAHSPPVSARAALVGGESGGDSESLFLVGDADSACGTGGMDSASAITPLTLSAALSKVSHSLPPSLPPLLSLSPPFCLRACVCVWTCVSVAVPFLEQWHLALLQRGPTQEGLREMLRREPQLVTSTKQMRLLSLRLCVSLSVCLPLSLPVCLCPYLSLSLCLSRAP